MDGFGPLANALFRDATATLYDGRCAIERAGARVSNGRFGATATAPVTVADDVPCTLQHNVANLGGRADTYAERLAGRALTVIYLPRSYAVQDRDTIRVHGGDTYEVVGPPHLDGPDDPSLAIPAAANAPVATNP